MKYQSVRNLSGNFNHPMCLLAAKPFVRKSMRSFTFASVVAFALLESNLVADPGTITFGNHSTSKVINGQTSNPVTQADNVRVALYWAPLGSSAFVQIGSTANVGIPLAGLFAGGTRTTGPATSGGSSAKFQVRAWGGGYATYEQALPHAGILIGQSGVFTNQTGNPAGDPPTPPVSITAGGFPGFALTNNAGSSQPPAIYCATNKAVECASVWTFDNPTAVDGCTGSNLVASILSTVTNGQCPQLIIRTWGVTNSCDTNFATCSQVVTNVDTTPPVLTCVSNKTVECGSDWAFDPPTAYDACGGSNVTVFVLHTLTNGICPQLLTRTWVAVDDCGNSNSCVQVVTVVDTTPPVVTCGTNKTVACTSAWDFDPPGAFDACSETNVTIGEFSTVTNSLCPLMITRTWLATDVCGNTNLCSQTVSVSDTTPLVVHCTTNKIVNCETNWDFDAPFASSGCSADITISVLDTSTNAGCPRIITRTWGITNLCNGDSSLCTQFVTEICPDCQGLALTKSCPPNPVPPGGILTFTGSVTNTSDLVLTNVTVVNDQPSPNTLVFGPATLLPGEGAAFGGTYTVTGCGPYVDTLIATGLSPSGIQFSNSVTAACAGAMVFVPGDRDGDGIVDQNELNAVLSNYWAHSPWVYMTNAQTMGGGVFQFALTNLTGWNFSVLVSTNLQDWSDLPGPAYPVYQFVDPEGTNLPTRLYRLRWP